MDRIQQLIETPVYCIEKDDIVYDQHHGTFEVVLDIKKDWDNEGDIEIRKVSADSIEFAKNHHGGAMIEAYELVPWESTLYKLVEISKDTITKTKELRDKTIQERYSRGGFEVVYEATEEEQKKIDEEKEALRQKLRKEGLSEEEISERVDSPF